MVSIIIPHYNGIEIVSECLDSLKASTFTDKEVIVVDNASEDGSTEWIEQNHSEVLLLRNRINEGYAGGCNKGAEMAKGEFLLFLNNDTVHEIGWLEPLVEELRTNPETASVQPKILNYFDRRLFDYAGACGGALDILAFPFARGRIFFKQETDSGQYDDQASIFWASGTALMIRKSDFEAAGRFDGTFFAHQEEIDLQWRLHLMGRDVRVIPSSVVYHKNAVTLPAQSVQKQYLNHRNSVLMLLSNYSLPLTLYLFPIRVALELIASVYAVVMLDFKHLLGILKSMFWIIFHPMVIVRRRRLVKSVRKVRDRAVISHMYKGSIVFDYYIVGKRSYRDLSPSPS
ncbi:MAG: glycosyltransferase family 2 protein [Candidatus Neomarinimicrobiota bacterium]|nr:glycosyltransferase family 2 protein [Candidatus Neomarinimicrobiota bacterium]